MNEQQVVEKNTEEIRKLTKELAERRKAEKQAKKDREDPSSIRQYLFRQTIGKINPMDFLPPSFKTLLSIGGDIKDIFEAKRVKSTVLEGIPEPEPRIPREEKVNPVTEKEREAPVVIFEKGDSPESASSELKSKIIIEKNGFPIETEGGAFDELLDQNQLMVGLIESLLDSSEGINDKLEKFLRAMLFEKENKLELEREKSRLRGGRGGLSGMMGGDGSGDGGDGGQPGFLSNILSEGLGNVLGSVLGGGAVAGGGGIISRVKNRIKNRFGRQTTPSADTGRTRSSRSRTRSSRSRVPTRTPRGLGRSRIPTPRGVGGKLGIILGAGALGSSLYNLFTGDATESYTDPDTGTEMNPFAGGLDPNLIGAAYGTEMMLNTTGLLQKGPSVTGAARNIPGVQSTLNRASQAGSAMRNSTRVQGISRAAAASRNALSSVRGARAVGTAVRAGAVGLGGGAMNLLGGPVGVAALAVQVGMEEYLARLQESNQGKAISLSGGVRREGDSFISASTGETLASLVKTDGLSGTDLADAQKQNRITTSHVALMENTRNITESLIQAERAYNNDDDATARAELIAMQDLLKYRVTLAGNLAGVFGYKAGSPEAEAILSLNMGGEADIEGNVKQRLLQLQEKLSFFEFVDSGTISETIDLLNQSTTTATSEVGKSFESIQTQAEQNVEKSQETVAPKTDTELERILKEQGLSTVETVSSEETDIEKIIENKLQNTKIEEIKKAKQSLDDNAKKIVDLVNVAKSSFERGNDATRVLQTISREITKRKELAAEMSGLLGYKAGSPEAARLSRLSPNGSLDYDVRKILIDMKTDSWFITVEERRANRVIENLDEQIVNLKETNTETFTSKAEEASVRLENLEEENRKTIEESKTSIESMAAENNQNITPDEVSEMPATARGTAIPRTSSARSREAAISKAKLQATYEISKQIDSSELSNVLYEVETNKETGEITVVATLLPDSDMVSPVDVVSTSTESDRSESDVSTEKSTIETNTNRSDSSRSLDSTASRLEQQNSNRVTRISDSAIISPSSSGTGSSRIVPSEDPETQFNNEEDAKAFARQYANQDLAKKLGTYNESTGQYTLPRGVRYQYTRDEDNNTIIATASVRESDAVSNVSRIESDTVRDSSGVESDDSTSQTSDSRETITNRERTLSRLRAVSQLSQALNGSPTGVIPPGVEYNYYRNQQGEVVAEAKLGDMVIDSMGTRKDEFTSVERDVSTTSLSTDSSETNNVERVVPQIEIQTTDSSSSTSGLIERVAATDTAKIFGNSPEDVEDAKEVARMKSDMKLLDRLGTDRLPAGIKHEYQINETTGEVISTSIFSPVSTNQANYFRKMMGNVDIVPNIERTTEPSQNTFTVDSMRSDSARIDSSRLIERSRVESQPTNSTEQISATSSVKILDNSYESQESAKEEARIKSSYALMEKMGTDSLPAGIQYNYQMDQQTGSITATATYSPEITNQANRFREMMLNNSPSFGDTISSSDNSRTVSFSTNRSSNRPTTIESGTLNRNVTMETTQTQMAAASTPPIIRQGDNVTNQTSVIVNSVPTRKQKDFITGTFEPGFSIG